MSDQIKVELQDSFGNDKTIADAAWTSSLEYQQKESRKEEDVHRIINMLADLKHSVPFESVIFRFWMKLPIQTDRQIVTHRIASHSGMSGRYRTMPNEYLDIPEDVEDILLKLKAQCGNPKDPTPFSAFDAYYEICEKANNYYNIILSSAKTAEKEQSLTNSQYKRLREFFRGMLPQNNMTERVSIMNLRSFANFYKLRSSPDAQPEIQQIANEMLKQVKEKNVASIAIAALERNNWTI